MSAEPADPGKLPVRLVIALLAVILGATAFAMGLGRDDAPALPEDAVQQNGIAVYGAYLREPATDTAAAYFTVVNVGDETDTLKTVSSPAASSSMLHDVGKKPLSEDTGIDSASMVPTGEVVLDPGEAMVLQPTAGHMMLEGITGTIVPGSTVNLVLVFEKAGTITIKAPVIGLTEPAPTN